MTQIKKFNDNGVRAFEELLSKFREAREIDEKELTKLIEDTNLVVDIGVKVNIERKKNMKKFDLSKLLSDSLELHKNQKYYYDRGLWTWLSAFLLIDLVPLEKGGPERHFKENALYILEINKWTKYYRHLLAFPCWIYSELGEKGRIFLRGELYERGEIVEQLAAAKDIQRNISIVEAATLLYYDQRKDAIYKGAASKNQGGTARRFREVIQQIRMTFDLNAMTGSQIVGVLPNEFDKWKKDQK